MSAAELVGLGSHGVGRAVEVVAHAKDGRTGLVSTGRMDGRLWRAHQALYNRNSLCSADNCMTPAAKCVKGRTKQPKVTATRPHDMPGKPQTSFGPHEETAAHAFCHRLRHRGP